MKLTTLSVCIMICATWSANALAEFAVVMPILTELTELTDDIDGEYGSDADPEMAYYVKLLSLKSTAPSELTGSVEALNKKGYRICLTSTEAWQKIYAGPYSTNAAAKASKDVLAKDYADAYIVELDTCDDYTKPSIAVQIVTKEKIVAEDAEVTQKKEVSKRLTLENETLGEGLFDALIIKQGVTLRDAIYDISKLRKWDNVYYDLQNVQYAYTSDRDQVYTITSLTDINQALNKHYQLAGENSVYLHENASRMIVTNKRYNGQLYVFDVQATNLFENLVRLTAHYDWTIEGWPLPYHYLIETPYPMIIDSLEDGLRKLLSHFPLQAQALHNTRNILLAPRTKAIKSGINDE